MAEHETTLEETAGTPATETAPAEAPAAAAAPEAAPEDVVVVGEDQGGEASEEIAGAAEDGSEAPDDKAQGS